MLPWTSIALIILGVLVAFLGPFSRCYVRSRLRESGADLKSWVTMADEFRYTEKYLKLAKTHDFPIWPAIIAIVWVPVSFILVVIGLVLRR